jgi:hypothetical protein
MAMNAPRWMLLAAIMAAGISATLLQRMPDSPGPMLAGIFAGLAMSLLFALVLRRLLPDACDTAPPLLRKRYTREMMVAMGGYMALLFASIWLLKHVENAGLRALVALLPVPPIALLRAMIRYIRDVDELQQRIELQAVSFATAFVSLLYLSGGLLQTARVVAVPAAAAMIWVFPLVCLSYGLAKVVVARRYR